MTYKASAAGLEPRRWQGRHLRPDGLPLAGPERRAMLLDFADLVESSRAATSPPRTSAGRPRRHQRADRALNGASAPPRRPGDQPVYRARRRGGDAHACASASGRPTSSGRVVAVVGLGHVGEKLTWRLRRRCSVAAIRHRRSQASRGGRGRCCGSSPPTRWSPSATCRAVRARWRGQRRQRQAPSVRDRAVKREQPTPRAKDSLERPQRQDPVCAGLHRQRVG